jgi:hypothetical protein
MSNSGDFMRNRQAFVRSTLMNQEMVIYIGIPRDHLLSFSPRFLSGVFDIGEDINCITKEEDWVMGGSRHALFVQSTSSRHVEMDGVKKECIVQH